jgi:DNA-binding GntR family transcriptional regulator
MTKTIEIIPQQTLEAQVLGRLREAILEGYFEPDSQVNQVLVAQQLGTSRGPIRAALSKLEEEGLVVNVPHRGTFVTSLDRKKVRDLYDVRAVLEAHAVRLAVPQMSEADLNQFEKIVKQMQKAAIEGNTNQVIAGDFVIHEFFVERSGNSILRQTWSTLKIQVRRALAFRHRGYPNLQELADSHYPFIELIRSKDVEGAARLMDAHIREACDDLMERWSVDKEPAGFYVKP